MLKLGEDYTINENGLMVFTRQYHLKRGYCCKNQCLNCPWNYAEKLKANQYMPKEK
ncbi:DUF5522 domain-containing protein [Solitalea lacus]|uniref:DUF5522 domain-containing protein n=1 Tax=Solitalea lacus TaxID=2911172 RepID=UPI0021068700|nr:DUF5522 domain-containing protein [Solitalea lacus]